MIDLDTGIKLAELTGEFREFKANATNSFSDVKAGMSALDSKVSALLAHQNEWRGAGRIAHWMGSMALACIPTVAYAIFHALRKH